MELFEWLDHLGVDEAWIGEHHSFMRRANKLKVYPAYLVGALAFFLMPAGGVSGCVQGEETAWRRLRPTRSALSLPRPVCADPVPGGWR